MVFAVGTAASLAALPTAAAWLRGTTEAARSRRPRTPPLRGCALQLPDLLLVAAMGMLLNLASVAHTDDKGVLWQYLRRYVPGATPLGPDLWRPALAGGMIWPPAGPQALVIAPARVARGFVLAVREHAPLALAATPARLTVAPSSDDSGAPGNARGADHVHLDRRRCGQQHRLEGQPQLAG